METLKPPAKTKAKIDHRCDFCGEKIHKGDMYMCSSHADSGRAYSFKTHTWCDGLASRLDMYGDAGEDGVSQDYFMEAVSSTYDDIMIKMFTNEDSKKYQDAIMQLRHVKFREKMHYVIRHYQNLDGNQ